VKAARKSCYSCRVTQLWWKFVPNSVFKEFHHGTSIVGVRRYQFSTEFDKVDGQSNKLATAVDRTKLTMDQTALLRFVVDL